MVSEVDAVAQPLGFIASLGYGALGAFLPDATLIARKRHGGLPAFVKIRAYWVALAVTVVIGALFAAFMAPTKVLEALVFGAVAPTAITSMLGKASEQVPKQLEEDEHTLAGRSGQSFFNRMRDFWGR